jgi:hypothetical protein
MFLPRDLARHLVRHSRCLDAAAEEIGAPTPPPDTEVRRVTCNLRAMQATCSCVFARMADQSEWRMSSS